MVQHGGHHSDRRAHPARVARTTQTVPHHQDMTPDDTPPTAQTYTVNDLAAATGRHRSGVYGFVRLYFTLTGQQATYVRRRNVSMLILTARQYQLLEQGLKELNRGERTQQEVLSSLLHARQDLALPAELGGALEQHHELVMAELRSTRDQLQAITQQLASLTARLGS